MSMKRVVVLGGGYGGMNALHELLHHDLPNDVEIVVIDRNPYHSLKTEFYALTAGTKSDKEVRIDFPKDDRVSYEYGEVIEINTDEELIRLKGRDMAIAYDYLIIGL